MKTTAGLQTASYSNRRTSSRLASGGVRVLLLACLALDATLALAGCDVGGGTVEASDAVVLDVRCAGDADCPSGFECEDEVEQGVDVSYCVSHDGHTAGECPANFELEAEHGGVFCKPHGGKGNDDS